MKTYYEILGVQTTANIDEIKKQYRKLANEFHPDKNNGDKTAEEKFKVLVEAYGWLSDPEKRILYDQYLTKLRIRALQIQHYRNVNQQRQKLEVILGRTLLVAAVVNAFSSYSPKKRKKKWTPIKRRRRF